MIKKKRNNNVIISAYAPTLAVSKNNPQQSEQLYKKTTIMEKINGQTAKFARK